MRAAIAYRAIFWARAQKARAHRKRARRRDRKRVPANSSSET
jgi:hypothetical protein